MSKNFVAFKTTQKRTKIEKFYINFLCGAMRNLFGSWDFFQDYCVIVTKFIIKFGKNMHKVQIYLRHCGCRSISPLNNHFL